MTSTRRTVLPIVSMTAAGLLALDLVLPALPNLQTEVDAERAAAQGVVSGFLLGVAVSQLIWGEAVARLGLRRSALLGLGLTAVTAVLCALATEIETLVLWRTLQGLGAGVTTVVAPTALRALLPAAHQVRALWLMAMVESLAPTVGPALGATVLWGSGWRAGLGLLAAFAGLSMLAARGCCRCRCWSPAGRCSVR